IQYAGGVIQHCSSKGKIVLKFIKGLHLFIGKLLSVVDDGSLEKIPDKELRSIQRECKEFYDHNQLPQIWFLVVKKRHNTLLFTWDKQYNQINNIQSVIHIDVVLPNAFDFYLNSHLAVQGTWRATLDKVLHDETGLT
ncbi:unnamed protein product, partial [Rotaria sp. Silwood2]